MPGGSVVNETHVVAFFKMLTVPWRGGQGGLIMMAPGGCECVHKTNPGDTMVAVSLS